ncbi:hypothetical protein BJV82DRAFT_717047 [Fennellomyces sp. T-0311]|nr:hypothetical protein BJV82DRAFT_717047 [Fennellomyces sp. T-0311]
MPTATTTDLARFLATTGPEQFAKIQHHYEKPTVMARFYRKYKSKSSTPIALPNKPHAKHIPLPVYVPPTPSSSPSSSSIPSFPEPPSATTTTTMTMTTTQTEQLTKTECPHCCRCLPLKKSRRVSCPPAIRYTPTTTKKPDSGLTSQEAKVLFTMIEKLQLQLKDMDEIILRNDWIPSPFTLRDGSPPASTLLADSSQEITAK